MLIHIRHLIKNIFKRLMKHRTKYAFGKAKSISLSFGQLVLKLIEIISFSYSAILLYRGEISLGTMVASLAYIGAL